MTTIYRDTLITCQECGKQFVFPVEKQRQMAEQSGQVDIPTLCETCTGRVKYAGKLHGRIKWFRADKGYGFVVQDGGGEIFFHKDGVLAEAGAEFLALDEGQEVLFEVMDTTKGPQAFGLAHYRG